MHPAPPARPDSQKARNLCGGTGQTVDPLAWDGWSDRPCPGCVGCAEPSTTNITPEIAGAVLYIEALLIDSRTNPVRVATLCQAFGRLPAMKVEGEHGFTLCNGCYFRREEVAVSPV